MIASWGCELPRTPYSGRTSQAEDIGCAHMHVPLQNRSKKKRILKPKPERASLPFSVSLQRPLLTELKLTLSARRNT